MEIQATRLLDFLKQEVSPDFEQDKIFQDQKSYSSKSKNLLVSQKLHDNEFIVTLSLLIQDSGQQFSIHGLNDVQWQSILQQWIAVMSQYLLEDNDSVTSAIASDIANEYAKKLASVSTPNFEDPDSESNYAISTLGHIELECLNLLNTKQCWFEISNPLDDRENKIVRQISIPTDVNYAHGVVTSILDNWLNLQILDLDAIIHKKYCVKRPVTNLKVQIFVILAIFIVWLIAIELAPN